MKKEEDDIEMGTRRRRRGSQEDDSDNSGSNEESDKADEEDETDDEAATFLRRGNTRDADEEDEGEGDIEMGRVTRRRKSGSRSTGGSNDGEDSDDDSSPPESGKKLRKTSMPRSPFAFKHTIISISLGLATITALFAMQTLCLFRNTCTFSANALYAPDPATPSGSAAYAVVPLALVVILFIVPLGFACTLIERRTAAVVYAVVLVQWAAHSYNLFHFFSQQSSAADTASEYFSGPLKDMASHRVGRRYYGTEQDLESALSTNTALYGLFSLVGGGFTCVAAATSATLAFSLPSAAENTMRGGRRDDGL